jgi:hypothetical protein
LFGDERDPDGQTQPESLPDSFAWDTCLRVEALAEMVERFPDHLRHGARLMSGWPMIVSQHLDHRPEFGRIAALLDLGADYPLDVGPRRRRGAATPLLRYLEPLVVQYHKAWLLEDGWRGKAAAPPAPSGKPEKRGPDAGAPASLEAAEQAIRRVLAALPPLTRESAAAWSRLVIVPHVMLHDAATAETCRVPVLQNIWRHRSVKSRATFRSRLHSAVSGTLGRFARPG